MTVVLPAASVRRSVPLRAVCTTERSGRTASDMGSPTSATPLARVTCWKSVAVMGCTAAGAVVATAAVSDTATSSRADATALRLSTMDRMVDPFLTRQPGRARAVAPGAVAGGPSSRGDVDRAAGYIGVFVRLIS